MRKQISTVMHIDDLRPDNDLIHHYGDRFWVKMNGYDECKNLRDELVGALVRNDYEVVVSGKMPGRTYHCLGWESVVQLGREHPANKSIPWEAPVTHMIGSFRVNDALCRYSSDPARFETQSFGSDGRQYVMQGDGYLLRDGVPIIRVIDCQTIPVCLRVAGTASRDYSFTHEIPVKALSGDDMHKVNYAEFERMIRNILSVPNMYGSAKYNFNLVLGVRRWALLYAEAYKTPHLPMTESELATLGRIALLDGGAGEVERVLAMYRAIYSLNYDEPLPGLDQDSLNAIRASHA